MMVKLAKKLLKEWDEFLSHNRFVQKIIAFQHSKSLPPKIFDLIFRSSITRRIFNFYGNGVFLPAYHARDGKHYDYWLSYDSLYWHLWRQTDINKKNLQDILANDEFRNLFQDNMLVAAEIGFGIGKIYQNVWSKNNFKNYLAVEANPYVCDYTKAKYSDHQNLKILNQSLDEFMEQDYKFELLLCSGGVLMYMDKVTVDKFFQQLPAKGVKALLITDEGTPNEDTIRSDDTIRYNFRSRLAKAGYTDKKFVEKVSNRGIYEYFLMV